LPNVTRNFPHDNHRLQTAEVKQAEQKAFHPFCSSMKCDFRRN